MDAVASLLEVARIYSLLHGQVKFAVVLVVFVVAVAVQLRSMIVQCLYRRLVLAVVEVIPQHLAVLVHH